MPVEKTCPVCGKSFAPKRQSRQKYCSQECRQSAYREYRDSMSTRVERTCPVCGEVFTCKQDDSRKTCSRACAGKLRGNGGGGRKKGVADNPGYTRKCHDCQKPTNNYRCGECLRKWKMKRHVADRAGEHYDYGEACI